VGGGFVVGFEEKMKRKKKKGLLPFRERERCVKMPKKSDPRVYIYTHTLALKSLMFLMCYKDALKHICISY
jgi:hypothetical protein